ncbi:hypothetical protein F511_20299 [Dorcoceras hygrometricum]|uniref:Uncharacterized protein n=1 Tax=Dorcoceras hygrometricum TaxID=472368 RepID=A0A2Z7CZ20_9LAMI|nr:hypothetical protein F511_20299 [Dorcoceras hygrometricum]
MSLFDLQDVCIAIGSLATLDLPMVVDPIGIYGLKGPYSGQITHCPSYTFRIDLNKACDHNQLSSEYQDAVLRMSGSFPYTSEAEQVTPVPLLSAGFVSCYEQSG